MNKIEWKISESPVDYNDAMAAMNQRVDAIKNGTAGDLIWCLEHPSTYTIGTGLPVADTAPAENLKIETATTTNNAATTPTTIIATGRGGQTTWHGPGQRVCYVIMDITARGLHAHDYVQRLLKWVQGALKIIGIETFLPDDKDKIGLWVPTAPNQNNWVAEQPTPQQIIANKICAIGVRLSPSRVNNHAKLVASHGVAVNICPDLRAFDRIIPCGISDSRYGVTSVRALHNPATMADVDKALKMAWDKIW
ncbi:MAG: lipoyl(octanoyl) transferase LipB [Hydrotalea sp.]|nr:lipoyl(octanoyl) transferase LipB [Hydrotalea sp.]